MSVGSMEDGAVDRDGDNRRRSRLGLTGTLRVDFEAKYPIAALLLRYLILSENNFSV